MWACKSSDEVTDSIISCKALAEPLYDTMSMMVKLPPRRIIEASPRLHPPSYSAVVTCATIPGRSLPTTVNINQLFIYCPHVNAMLNEQNKSPIRRKISVSIVVMSPPAGAACGDRG